MEPPDTVAAEFRERWPLLLVLFLVQVIAFGFPTFALPFVYSGAMHQFGWTRHEAVLLASFKFSMSALAALAVGRVVDGLGPRSVVAVASCLGALAMAGFAAAGGLPAYYAIGIVLGLSAAGLSVAVKVTVSRVFHSSTGTMLGVVLAGTSTAGMLLPVVLVPLMGRVGWRAAMAALGCLIGVVALPAWLLLTRKGSFLHPMLRQGARTAAGAGMWSHIRQMCATRDFWLLLTGAFLVCAVDEAMVQNQVLFLQSEKGLALGMVAWGASLLAGIGIGAKVFFGWVFDRLSLRGIALCYLLLAVAIGLSFAVKGVATMLLFAAMVGSAHGGLIVFGPVLLKHRYGTDNLGLNLGIFTLVASLGYGFGPPFMAAMADRSGSYRGAFALSIAAAVLAAALLSPVRPKFWAWR